MNKWAELARLLVPIIIGTVKPELAPLGTAIANTMGEAEEIFGDKSGTKKLEHVVKTVTAAVDITNAAAGREVVKPEEINSALVDGISTAVKVINIVKDAKDSGSK